MRTSAADGKHVEQRAQGQIEQLQKELLEAHTSAENQDCTATELSKQVEQLQKELLAARTSAESHGNAATELDKQVEQLQKGLLEERTSAADGKQGGQYATCCDMLHAASCSKL